MSNRVLGELVTMVLIALELSACGSASDVLEATTGSTDSSATDSSATDSSATSVESVISYLKASNSGSSDIFGSAVSISSDGNTLAIAARNEASSSTGVGGVQSSNAASDSGAVYVFTRSGGVWSQQAYIKASNTEDYDYFGGAVSLSSDGATLAVGASSEDSSATGVGGDQSNNAASDSGAVYVFTRSGGAWSQQAYIKASNTEASDYFGGAVSLSSDGATLAIGAEGEDSSATGVGGLQSNNTRGEAGAVYVYSYTGGMWAQQAYLKASNTGRSDFFGSSVSLSSDGATLAVGAYGESSNATGVGGDQSNNSASESGAVYMFTRISGTWAQQAYLKASNTGGSDFFGSSVSLSSDGATLAVGAYGESSNATGVGGDQSNNAASDSGAVYLFIQSGGVWAQSDYIKASNTEAYDYFGRAVSLSSDGATLAVGAIFESSSATGVGGDQSNNAASDSGAVYVF